MARYEGFVFIIKNRDKIPFWLGYFKLGTFDEAKMILAYSYS